MIKTDQEYQFIYNSCARAADWRLDVEMGNGWKKIKLNIIVTFQGSDHKKTVSHIPETG